MTDSPVCVVVFGVCGCVFVAPPPVFVHVLQETRMCYVIDDLRMLQKQMFYNKCL